MWTDLRQPVAARVRFPKHEGLPELQAFRLDGRWLAVTWTGIVESEPYALRYEVAAEGLRYLLTYDVERLRWTVEAVERGLSKLPRPRAFPPPVW